MERKRGKSLVGTGLSSFFLDSNLIKVTSSYHRWCHKRRVFEIRIISKAENLGPIRSFVSVPSNLDS